MQTFKITYSFGQMDPTRRIAEITLAPGYTVGQAASIFAARMDCRFLQIHEICNLICQH
jgi:hypothetical protein